MDGPGGPAEDSLGRTLVGVTRRPSDWRLVALELVMVVLRAGPVLMLLLLMAVLALLEPVFLTPRNIGNVLAQTAVISRPGDGPAAGHRHARRGPVGRRDGGACVGRGCARVQRGRPRPRDRAGDAGDRAGRGRHERLRARQGPHAAPVHRHARVAERGPRAGAVAGGWPLHRAGRDARRHPLPGQRQHRLRARQRRSSSVSSRSSIAVFTKRMVWGRWIFAVGGNPEGCPARRHPGPMGDLLGVRAERTAGRCRCGARVRSQQRRLTQLRSARGARLHRRRGHRRRELPGRPRQRRQRAGGGADDRRHPQRHEPAERRRLPAADRDRRRHRGRRSSWTSSGARSSRGCASCGRQRA